ncbi:Serp2 [Gossypium arboreum]|uniref:Serp2 n=1 Tax=Gossypium arboreum TaxID=29729 RepID=A0A0B0NI87_GOSAR|nr:Serp2 [Gossypium arboreum]
MTTSRRLAERKVEKFQKNITKRGAVPETTTKKGKDYPVGPLLLGFFIFVVIGSCKDSLPSYFLIQCLSSRLSGQRPAEVWHKSALLMLRNCEETGHALGFAFLLVL